MIEAKNLTKRFGSLMAVDHINAQILDGSVFGLIGTNGAGKSTFLRMLSGVLKPDEGSVTIDGKEVYENVEVKSRFFYISDDQYFFSNSTPEQLMKFYMGVYPKFNKNRFIHLMDSFELDRKRKINTFSKGMKKQVSVICGVCAGTDYLFCDETFDGLDPVMRQTVKSIFAAELVNRSFTPVIASHNLRELEDICDHVGLLHEGGIIFNQEIDNLRLGTHKIQCAFKEPKAKEDFKGLDILHYENYGSLSVMIIRGSVERTQKVIDKFAPLYSEVVPMSLEEIFISEMEVRGYDSEGINL